MIEVVFFSDWHIVTELLPCLCGKFGIVGFATIPITIPTVNGAKDGPSHNSNQRGRTLMEPGYTGRSNPSLRLLGSLGNTSLSSQGMVDRHAQVKAFLLNLAQEFAKEIKLPLENATILQAKLLLHAAVVGKKPLKLCQVVGEMPWINKYMMKRGRFTSEAMDVIFSAIGQQLPPSIGSQTGTHCDKIKMSSGVRRIQGQAAKIATVHDMHDMCHFTSHYIYKVYI